jgi:hypothetical protein
MPKHAMRGVPDIIVVKDGKFIGIEVKTKDGRLSADQPHVRGDCRYLYRGAEH